MNNTNEREDLIAELLRSADLLQIGKVDDWGGLAAEILQAVEMLKADLQDFETYSGIIKSSTAREQHTRETLHKVLAGIQTQQVAVPMTDDQIIAFNDAAFDKYMTQDARALEFARAIEKHHGIGAK